MNFIRVLRMFFGVAATVLTIAALGDVVHSGRLNFMQPTAFGALVAVVIVFVLNDLVAARERSQLLDKQAEQLRSTAAQLKSSLDQAAAINALLHQSEARYKGLVAVQGDAIVRRDAHNRITYANDVFLELFDLSPEESIGASFTPEMHIDRRSPNFGGLAGVDTGHTRVREDQHLNTARGWRWIAWEDYAVRDENGVLAEIQSVGRDITERKALEEALTEKGDKAEAASRAKSSFLATVSHEIRTPMSGVIGMARLLLETELEPEQRTYAEAITHSGEALLGLIGDILDFSKIEAGVLTLDCTEVNVRGLLEEVAELLGPRAHAKNIEIVAVAAPDVPLLIHADVMRLRQVLTNLVGNAVKFTERGGVRVDVSVEGPEDQRSLRFSVRDTGLGVAEEKKNEIFREFVQGDPSHARKFGGSGLGLAISKRLVEAMGGEIGLDSLPGDGSCFWFTLPAEVAAPAATEPPFALTNLNVTIITQNGILREGLAAQVEAGGGNIAVPSNERGPTYQNLHAVLIDAGTETDPDPLFDLDPDVPAIVLVTPAARAKLDALKAMGFAGYLVKPVRQSSLVQQLLLRLMPSRHPQMTIEDARVPTPHIDVARARAPQSGLKILLAEDNAVNALLTRELLRRRGHRVTEVTAGEAAVAAIESDCFDLMLTDIHMPGMDGIEATKLIRANEALFERQRMPIVALTADVLDAGRKACQDAGMDGFLIKPVDPAELDEMLSILFPSGEDARIAAA